MHRSLTMRPFISMILAILVLVSFSGCGWFGGGSKDPEDPSVVSKKLDLEEFNLERKKRIQGEEEEIYTRVENFKKHIREGVVEEAERLDDSIDMRAQIRIKEEALESEIKKMRIDGEADLKKKKETIDNLEIEVSKLRREDPRNDLLLTQTLAEKNLKETAYLKSRVELDETLSNHRAKAEAVIIKLRVRNR